MRQIGYLVASNSRHKKFHYPLMWEDGLGWYVKAPDMVTAPISLSLAKSQGAKLLLNPDAGDDAKAAVRAVWR